MSSVTQGYRWITLSLQRSLFRGDEVIDRGEGSSCGRGDVRGHRSAQARRAKRLRITEKGKDKAVAAIEVVEAVDRRFFEPVDDRKALLAILKRLAN